MNHIAHRTGRRGGFVTVMVLLALMVASIAFLALGNRTSQVHRRTSDHGARTLAMLLAESALEEAHARAGRLANDPDAAAEGGVKLFDRFRVWGDRGGADALSTSGFQFKLDLPRTRELAAAAPFAVHQFTVEVESEVPSQLPVLRANDRAGLVIHRATVKGCRITEVLERQYGFRVSLSSPMRPFERVTLMVEDAADLFSSPKAGEPGLTAMIGGLAVRWQGIAKDRKDTVAELRQALASRPPTATAINLDQSALAALEQAPEDFGIPAGKLAERIQILEEQRYLIAVHSMRKAASGEAKVDMAELDWTRTIGPELEKISEQGHGLLDELDTLRQAASSDFAKGEDANAIIARAVANAQQFEQHVRTVLDKTNAFTRDFRAFGPQETKLREEFESSLELLSPAAWAARAYLKVDAADMRMSNGTLADFLSRRGHPARPFSGILFWNNPGRPLVLNGFSYSGKMVIVATGDVEVSAVKKADKDSLLTVVAFGTMKASGHVEASLVAGGALDLQAGAKIQGNLIARQYSRSMAGAISLDPYLTAGWGTKDPASESAAAKRHYHVAFSPGPLSTSVKS